MKTKHKGILNEPMCQIVVMKYQVRLFVTSLCLISWLCPDVLKLSPQYFWPRFALTDLNREKCVHRCAETFDSFRFLNVILHLCIFDLGWFGAISPIVATAKIVGSLTFSNFVAGCSEGEALL